MQNIPLTLTLPQTESGVKDDITITHTRSPVKPVYNKYRYSYLKNSYIYALFAFVGALFIARYPVVFLLFMLVLIVGMMRNE